MEVVVRNPSPMTMTHLAGAEANPSAGIKDGREKVTLSVDIYKVAILNIPNAHK